MGKIYTHRLTVDSTATSVAGTCGFCSVTDEPSGGGVAIVKALNEGPGGPRDTIADNCVKRGQVEFKKR